MNLFFCEVFHVMANERCWICQRDWIRLGDWIRLEDLTPQGDWIH